MSRKRPLMDVDDNRWSEHLPDELIEMIVKRLTLADSIRFAAVCPSWRSVSSHWFRRVSRLPWLLKSIKFLDSETVKYSLYSPSEDTVYDLKFPRESAASPDSDCRSRIRCSGSIDGWLIMSEWSTRRWWGARTSINYLLNPMTGDRIKLPQLKGIIPQSSTASSDPRNSDCIVAIAKLSELVFCRPDSHIYHSWLWKDEHKFDIQLVKFHEDGKLYAIERVVNTTELQILVLVLDSVLVTNPILDQCDCKGKGKYEKIIAHRVKTIVTGSAPRGSYGLLMYSIPSIIWSSKGDLLLVQTRVFPQEPDKKPEFPVHYVLKTDDTNGCNPIWVNATNDIAEDQVLFLSREHSTLMSKPAKGCMPTIDECFFALLRGKPFTHYWNEGTMLNDGIWFTPNIIKSC